MRRDDLTAERLREEFDYDPETGVFRHRNGGKHNRYKPGQEVGAFDGLYLRLKVLGVRYRAHRLAWLHVHGEWPKKFIDHINGDKTDNRIANLRDVSAMVNLQNRRDRPIGSTGFRGVTAKPSGKYAAQITVGYKNHFLGLYSTPEMAHEAYISAKREMHEGYAE